MTFYDRVWQSGLSNISVAGYKSLKNISSLEIKPITLISGANSSGKSSIMQPLLLLKQTIEAPYSTSSLIIDGAHVSFSRPDEMFTKNQEKEIVIEITVEGVNWTFTLGLESNKVVTQILRIVNDGEHKFNRNDTAEYWNQGNWNESSLVKSRFFIYRKDYSNINEVKKHIDDLSDYISNIVHLSGSRFIPQRAYKGEYIGGRIEGPFDTYVASILRSVNKDIFKEIVKDLYELGLTSNVKTRQNEKGDISIFVSRSREKVDDKKISQKQKDELGPEFVNLADVGLGISQILPVIVALRFARKGQLVYIEQPELHLHPRAQRHFCNLLVSSVERGVKVVLETHSQLILRGIQILVAKDEINYMDVNLLWFELNDELYTIIKEGNLDNEGAFSEWPNDFSEVALSVEKEYLNAGWEE